ncbi:MAG: PQQ-binding-like beta-propeller repeat protein, partial [Aureliella sp.]
APYVPTPVALGELLFLWGDTGIVSCVKLPSAEVLWSKRIGGNVSSSPVIAGNKLIGIAEDGTVTILSATPEFSELGSIKLNETCRATPALSQHFILLRTQSRMLCIGSPTVREH